MKTLILIFIVLFPAVIQAEDRGCFVFEGQTSCGTEPIDCFQSFKDNQKYYGTTVAHVCNFLNGAYFVMLNQYDKIQELKEVNRVLKSRIRQQRIRVAR